MIGALPVTTDDVANYDLIARLRADEGDSDRPAALASLVKRLYKQYAGGIQGGGAASPHGFSTTDRRALQTNYRLLSRVHFDSLRSAILQAAGGKCPFCHLARANEIDHFLPKAHFGEYSVFALNLVPICTACNKKKSNRYRHYRAGRRYIHPYFDALPSELFLRVNVQVGPALGIQFAVDPPSTMLPATAERLRVQFEDLGLSKRYADEALDEVMSRLGSLYVYFDTAGAAGVEKYLRTDAQSAAARRGLNHWLPLTLAALADSDEFCDQGFTALGPRPPI